MAQGFWGPAPLRKSGVHYITRCPSLLTSGDWSANPASVPGRSGLLRALLSVSSAQKCSGAGRLATPSGVSRADRLAVSCRSPASGHKARGQSWEAGSLSRSPGGVGAMAQDSQSWKTHSLSRLFGSVETTAKCVSMGHAHCRTRLSRRSAAAFQRGHSKAGGSRAGSGNGTRSEHSPEEGGHRGGPSYRQRVGFYSSNELFLGRMGGCVLFSYD